MKLLCNTKSRFAFTSSSIVVFLPCIDFFSWQQFNYRSIAFNHQLIQNKIATLQNQIHTHKLQNFLLCDMHTSNPIIWRLFLFVAGSSDEYISKTLVNTEMCSVQFNGFFSPRSSNLRNETCIHTDNTLSLRINRANGLTEPHEGAESNECAACGIEWYSAKFTSSVDCCCCNYCCCLFSTWFCSSVFALFR